MKKRLEDLERRFFVMETDVMELSERLKIATRDIKEALKKIETLLTERQSAYRKVLGPKRIK